MSVSPDPRLAEILNTAMFRAREIVSAAVIDVRDRLCETTGPEPVTVSQGPEGFPFEESVYGQLIDMVMYRLAELNGNLPATIEPFEIAAIRERTFRARKITEHED